MTVNDFGGLNRWPPIHFCWPVFAQAHVQEAILTTIDSIFERSVLHLKEHNHKYHTLKQNKLLQISIASFSPFHPQPYALRMGLPVAMVSTRWVVMARPLVAKIARMVFIASGGGTPRIHEEGNTVSSQLRFQAADV